MGQNNTGQLRIVTSLVATSAYAFAPNDDTVVLRQIPAGGVVLTLPAGAQSGDRYEFVDGDGSCSTVAPITVSAPSGVTIRDGGSIQFAISFAAATVVFDESSKSWVVVSQTSPLFASARIREFTSNATLTVPPNVTQLEVEGFGGGGGGGQGQAGGNSGAASQGGSGGGGAVAFRYALPVAVGDTFTVTIGGGGLGATAGTDGFPGGASTFLDSLGFGLTFPGASGGSSGTDPWTAGGPSVTAQGSNASVRGTSARGGPGAGGVGGNGSTASSLATAGADNSGPIINAQPCLGGSPGASGSASGGIPGGGGGGGGGAGPGGSGGSGGAGGNGASGGTASAGAAGGNVTGNSGAGGGGGGAGGNGSTGGAGGKGGNGGSGFIRVTYVQG